MNLVDELEEFLRLQMVAPEVVAPVDEAPCSAILIDDDNYLVNCLIVATTSAVTSEQIATVVGRLLRHEALRTALVVPDDMTTSQQEKLRREGVQFFGQLSSFTKYLDNHLRPDRVCAKLLQPGQDAPNARAGLLFEEDFIAPDAVSQGAVKVQAMQHLVVNWSRGVSPRVGVILAPAGYGKSKLTHILAKRLAKVYSEKATPGAPLPYLIPFGDYRGTNTFDGLISLAQAEHGAPLLTPGAFRFLVSRGRALLILDGYDEMLDKFPHEAKSNIGEFISKAGPSSRLILTARTLFYRSSGEVVGMVGDPNFTTDDVELLELQPFDRGKARTYLRIKLDRTGDKSRLVERSQQLLDRVQGGLGIYGSPFFLSEFVAQVREDADKFTISGAPTDFLDYLVGVSFARERIRQGHDFSDKEQQAFLENIALDMLRSERTAAYDKEDLELFALEAVSNDHIDIDDQRLPLLFAHHFLDPVDGYASFQHQVWRDYFQGKALARAFSTERIEAIDVLNRRELPDGIVNNCVSAGDRWLLAARLGAVADRTNDVGMRNLLRLLTEIAREKRERYVIPAPISERMAARSLSDLYLTNLDFSGADLRGCVFTGTYLRNCDLRDTHWNGAFLSNTTFIDCEIGSEIATADHASSVIDGEEFFGPQLRERFAESTEGAAAEGDSEDARETPERYAIRVLAGRLGKFQKGNVFDTSIDWSNFMGGLPRADHDFVVKRLVRALKAEGILMEDSGVAGSRPPFILTRDSGVRRDVATLTSTNEVGHSLQPVVDRLLKRRD
ncbi:NACHT domain-containing protein [Microbacterium sp.]|uniref:NACHT domain-containing protein n=1 Tax=Microbacterium sp. TaxID=51671 RepID=UPI003C7634C8